MTRKIKAFLQAHSKTQSWLAANIGVSDAQLSSYLKSSYVGDVQSLELKLNNFIDNFIEPNNKSQDEAFFIKTKNTTSVTYILEKAIKQTRLSVITGNAGYGKTTAIKRFIKDRPEAIYIKANNLFTTKDFLEILCQRLNIKIERRGRDMFNNVIKALSRVDRFIVIDEAEWLKDKTLDMIRNIWEESDTAVILSGTLHLKQNLKGARGELDYVDSRVRGRVTLNSLNDSEFKAVCSHYGVEKEALKKVKAFTGGNFRLTIFLLEESRDLADLNRLQTINEEIINEASRMIVE